MIIDHALLLIILDTHKWLNGKEEEEDPPVQSSF